MIRAYLAVVLAVVSLMPIAGHAAQEAVPLITASPTILIRSPDPAQLMKFYQALGFKKFREAQSGGTIFHIEGDIGSLEILQMDKNTKPSGPKTTRTQQGVVAIFETTDQAGIIARAKAAGATLVEKWDASDRPISIYYVGDPEHNIIGFAPRHHNPEIKTP